MRGGKKVPAAIQRMRSDDLLVKAFPEVLACPETLSAPKIEIPTEHPIVRQTVEDCLTEAMDVEGFLDVLRRIRSGEIETRAVDTPEPSSFARAILSARPYSFLDDAPLEERRTQAVLSRRTLDPRTADELGALDAAAVERVRGEAWPEPRDAEEIHEALLWIGYVTEREAAEGGPPGVGELCETGPLDWRPWLEELHAGGRVQLDDGRWFAAEATRDPKAVLRGRMEALGPVVSDDPLMLELEKDGAVLRARMDGQQAWCDRRLLARIHRYTVERLRKEIAPVQPAEFLRFLACWQHVDPAYQLEGPQGVAAVLEQLAGHPVPARAWEGSVLPSRVRGYRREWLDQLTLSGQYVWGRLWDSGAAALKTAPLCFVPREHLDHWGALLKRPEEDGLSAPAREVLEILRRRGAVFQDDLARWTRLLPSHLEIGLAELVSRGFVTCDGFATLRQLLAPFTKRKAPVRQAGRWSLLHDWLGPRGDEEDGEAAPEIDVEFFARRLLARTGVVFRRTVARERLPVPWRDLLRVYRRLELRGDVRGGRFVAGFDGEQYALPQAVRLLRKVRREGHGAHIEVEAADPLNLRGILTPDARISPTARQRVAVG